MAQNKTHALVHNGTPHDEQGYELTDPKVTTGEGSAKCKCGWLSEDLGSGAARREAYKRHIAEPSIDTDDPEDLIGDPAPKATPKPKATPAGLADPGEGFYADVPFEVTPTWLWPILGRFGAYTIAEAMKATGASHDDKSYTVRLTGTETRVVAAADLLVATWDAVGPARKAWKKTDPTFRALLEDKSRGWQTRAGNAEREFTRDFVNGVAARIKKGVLEETPGAMAAAEADLEALVKAARK